MPGSAIFRLPTEIASEATTKNQPPRHRHHRIPDKAWHRERDFEAPEALPSGKAKAVACFIEIVWDGAQGLEEAEGHVPGLAGEDGKDRGKLGAQRPVRRQGDEEHHGEGEIAQHRYGLEDIEEWDQHHLGAAALRRQRAVSEAEDERYAEREQHPQDSA
jgi:hypothetical protein